MIPNRFKYGIESCNALNVWALYIYGPLLEDKIRKIQDHHGASYAKELLGKVRKELKKNKYFTFRR